MSFYKRIQAFIMPVLTFVFCVLMLTGCGAVSEYVPKPSAE